MTSLPTHVEREMGLVIDLDTCVGCHACVVACKGWNDQGMGAPLSDTAPYGAEPVGVFLNRVHSYEVQPEDSAPFLVHFPKSCLHCREAPCVTVCPTGASLKRAVGAGPGAREQDPSEMVMKKCTLCADRIYDEAIPEVDRQPACVRTCPAGARHFGDLSDSTSDVSRLVAERGGVDLMPEQGTGPVNKYLPPRPRDEAIDVLAPLLAPVAEEPQGFLGWLDRTLSKVS